MRETPSRVTSGFTLFEVMAAVLVLGVLYTVLASTAIHGLRSEGESRRRMEASLVADEQLIELESGLATGLFPEIGTLETEIDQFQVSIEVTPFDVTPYLGEDFLEAQREGEADSLLAMPDQENESLLRRVSVEVRWQEAEGEHNVRRTTLAYDQTAIAGLFEAPGAGAAGDGAADDDLSGFVNPDGSPNLDAMMERLQGLTGEAP